MLFRFACVIVSMAALLVAPDHATYFQRFRALLAETDVLWTKPSELTFFGALGLPLLLAPPVGIHESYNLRWAREAGWELYYQPYSRVYHHFSKSTDVARPGRRRVLRWPQRS